MAWDIKHKNLVVIEEENIDAQEKDIHDQAEKFKGESMCAAPHLYKQRIKELFEKCLL